MRRETVTMHQVAALAGVSIKTVSNVVNDSPVVRPETRARVTAAIEELGYQVNISARNLRRGRTGLIGLAVPELSVPYFAELADSVMSAASARGVTVLIEQTGAQRDRELAVLGSEHRNLTDGLLFSPLALGQDDVGRLPVRYPLVLLGEGMFGGPFDHVTMANVDGAASATEHLLRLGRRRIAVVGHHPGETVGSAALRVQGYRRALEAAGVPFDERLLGEAGQWHLSTGADAMRSLLDSGVEIDAVFGLNDAVTLGALHVLHERRIAVPDDLLVIGFDAVQETAYSSPPLSSVDPGRDEIARTAVDLLLDRVAGSDEPPRTVVATHRVVVRGSTVPLALPSAGRGSSGA